MTHIQPEGFLVFPDAGKGPGVLVLHAWWGLNETIKTVCDQLAMEGFVAFAPDLYHGKIATTIEEAERLAHALGSESDRASADLTAAVEFLSMQASESNRGIAVVGFSLGASYALDLSAADPEHVSKVVVFYGTGDADFNRSTAAFLGHFAQNDPYEEQEYVDGLEQALIDAGRPVTFYRYPDTGHWFFEPDRTDAFAPEAAELAWKRTLAFLKDSPGV